MNIKDTLHRIFFPSFANELKQQTERADDWYQRAIEHEATIVEMSKKPVPTMADLMREVLGITSLNIAVTETDGYPKHFLDTYSPAEREHLTAELHQIQTLEAWRVMIKYHKDKQGNFIVKKATDEQMAYGRMMIAGIRLLEDEVLNGHNEYLDRSKPPDTFDKFSVDLLNEDELINNYNQ